MFFLRSVLLIKTTPGGGIVESTLSTGDRQLVQFSSVSIQLQLQLTPLQNVFLGIYY